MGQKAYKERLKQIKMDPVDADLYEQFSSSVQKQVRNLNRILNVFFLSETTINRYILYRMLL